MQRGHRRAHAFSHGSHEHKVIFVVGNGRYGSSLQAANEKWYRVTMSNHQRVSGPTVEQVAQQGCGVLSRSIRRRDVQQLGQWGGGLLGAFHVSDINLFDVGVFQHFCQALGPLLAGGAQRRILSRRSFLSMTHQKNHAAILLCCD